MLAGPTSGGTLIINYFGDFHFRRVSGQVVQKQVLCSVQGLALVHIVEVLVGNKLHIDRKRAAE